MSGWDGLYSLDSTHRTRASGQSPRAARLLALAYLVDRMVESGKFSGYADAARAFGVTRARMCQVTDLLNLAPPIQERILLRELELSERELRRMVRERVWEGQGVVVGP